MTREQKVERLAKYLFMKDVPDFAKHNAERLWNEESERIVKDRAREEASEILDLLDE